MLRLPNKVVKKITERVKLLAMYVPCPECNHLVERHLWVFPWKDGRLICPECRFEFCAKCLNHYLGAKHEPGQAKFCEMAGIARNLPEKILQTLE